MMLPSLDRDCTLFLSHLAAPAARSLVVAGIAASGLAALRVRAAARRLAVWKIVLGVALLMPLLAWVLPAVPVAIPIAIPGFPGRTTAASAASAGKVSGLETAAAGVYRITAEPTRHRRSPLANSASPAVTEPAPPVVPERSSPAVATHRSISWPIIAAAFYLAVLFVFLARLALGFIMSRRLLRAARPVTDPAVLHALARIANSSAPAPNFAQQMRALPRIAESDLVFVPATLGALEPAIILPAAWREWNAAKLEAVLAHEFSHVRRRDALTQRLSLLHRAFFWFSPLAWWLDRALATLAEIASDDAALSSGLDRVSYAETLLGFVESLQQSRRRVWWQGVSMASAGNAERRIAKILSGRNPMSAPIRRSFLFAAVFLAGPVLIAAAAVRPYFAGVQFEARRSIQATPSTPSAPSPSARNSEAAASAVPAVAPAPLSPVQQTSPASSAPAPAPSPAPAREAFPLPVIAPVPMPTAIAPIVTKSMIVLPTMPIRVKVRAPVILALHVPMPPDLAAIRIHPLIYLSSDVDGPRFVIVSGGTTTMSGFSDDAANVQALRDKISGDFVWFERDGKSYIIRDPATVKRAKELFSPTDQFSKQQDELSAQQDALGKQQEALSRQMDQVRIKVPDMTAQLRELETKMRALSDGGTQEQLNELESELGDLQSRLAHLQALGGDAQSKIAEQMGELGRRQGELGRRQAELGLQEQRLSEESNRQLEKLFQDAIASGAAKPE